MFNSVAIHFAIVLFFTMEPSSIPHDVPKTNVIETDDTKKTDTAQTDFAYSEAPLKRSLAQRHLVG